VLQQAAPKDAELRLALGMRGGVSLAVWIGGACAEIDELRRAVDEKQGFWWELLQESPYGRVAVDVMAGASAGGLNGVVFAAAIRHGFPMDQTMRVWRQLADVNQLRRKTDPWSSLFDGDARFLDVVHDELDALIAGRDLPEEQRTKQKDIREKQASTGYVDLQLSATLVEPIDSGAISPGDETLRRSRSSARFHFRHDPSAVPERLDIEHTDVARLAVAARGTASFPIAFDAAMVRATRPAEFELRPSAAPGVEMVADDSEDQRRSRQRLVDCRWVFSEGRGAANESGTPFGDDDFTVADGGAVDNIPLGKALDAVRDAPASGPTRRVLVYLHPTGPTGVAGRPKYEPRDEPAAERAVRRRNPVSVLSGLVASQIQSESIDGDLARLEDHNRTIRLARLLRQTLLTELVQLSTDPHAAGDPKTPIGLAGRRLRGYLVQRAGANAEAIEALLADPLAVLGEDPFPQPPPASAGYTKPEDRWRSPIAGWTSDQRLLLDTALRDQFIEHSDGRELGMDVLLAGGLGPIVRSIDLLLELAREGEKQEYPGAEAEAIGRVKPPLYKLGSFVRELVRVRQLAWVCRAGCLDAQDDVHTWVKSTLAELRMLHRDAADVVAALGEPTGPDFVATARALLVRRAADLHTLAGGGSLPVRKDADLREALVTRLEAMAQPLLARLPPPPDDPVKPQSRSGAEVIQRVLVDPSGGDFSERLASLEVLLLDEHLVGAPGHMEIGFTRMSAAAPIIGAKRFTQLYAYSQALDEARTRGGNYLAPDVKLAGNELASFSAFLDEDWRVNDWTWGRLDATATLVDLLLGEDRPDRDDLGLDPDELLKMAGPAARALAGPVPVTLAEKRQHARRALTARRQNELLKLAPGDGLPADLGKWRAGLETLVNPGSPELAAAVTELSNVGAQVVAAVLPSRVPRIVGPLQGLLRVIARRFSKPTGVLPDPVRTALGERGIESAPPEAKLGFPWLALVSALVGTGLAALAYAAADNTVSLAIGLAVGLVVGLVPGAILLWLSVQPVRPRQQWPWFTTAVAFGLVLGAGVTAVVVAALRAWL
jgi:hypothetical protein